MKNYSRNDVQELGREVVSNCRQQAKRCAQKGLKKVENYLYFTVGTGAILYSKIRGKKNRTKFVEIQ
ncbi:hypothetical protein [Fusobacterium sp.]|uniref:hypothetical protein n=1 Tax=Fusobacterium sp. TaxID=68766 RepID=UPI00396CB725